MKRKHSRAVLALIAALLLGVLLATAASAAVGPIEPELSDSPVTQGEEPADPQQPDMEPGGGTGSRDPNLQDPGINININGETSDAVRIVLLMTILSVLPSLLLMLTSFTRIIIVFSLLRNALGLQQTPPNQVMVGLALFLSLFIMNPVISEINETAYQPFAAGEIQAMEFLSTASAPLKTFMLEQTNPEDSALFFGLAELERPENMEDAPMTVVIPSFIVSEIKRGFTIGFLIYIPFLIIDMVVASALMSMGMMMLPPVTISLPFKLMLFVLVDGWGLLIQTLVKTFN